MKRRNRYEGFSLFLMLDYISRRTLILGNKKKKTKKKQEQY